MMMIKKAGAAALLVGLVLFGFVSVGLGGQDEQASKAKVLGSWDVEVSAEGQSYFLTMVLGEKDGQLAGTVSEQNGAFTDVALSSLSYDGTTLTFEFNSPTPPDGVERLVQATFSWAGDALEGSVTVPDLGVTVPAKAAKKA
jgi:hypothetical protein